MAEISICFVWNSICDMSSAKCWLNKPPFINIIIEVCLGFCQVTTNQNYINNTFLINVHRYISYTTSLCTWFTFCFMSNCQDSRFFGGIQSNSEGYKGLSPKQLFTNQKAKNHSLTCSKGVQTALTTKERLLQNTDGLM